MARDTALTDDNNLTSRQIARRQKILKTVRKHLVNYGYDGLSMRKVAVDASVSPSTLYEIYQGKDELILSSIKDTILELSMLEEQSEPGVNRLINRLNSLAAIIMDSPELGNALVILLFQGNENSAAVKILLKNAFSARRASILEMQEQKQLRMNIDIDLYARSLVSITWGTILLSVKKEIPTELLATELIRSSISLLLSAATPKFRPSMAKLCT